MDGCPARLLALLLPHGRAARPAFIADFPSLKTDLFKDEVDFLLISISAKCYSAAGTHGEGDPQRPAGTRSLPAGVVVADSPNARKPRC
jgi:hypothetical protein